MFKNLFANMGMFLLGVAVTILPFVIYFAVKGAVGDFLYGTIGYNLEYAANMQSWLKGATWGDYKEFIRVYCPFILLLPAVVCSCVNKRYYLALYSFIAFVLELYLFTNGSLYVQYAVIAIPNIILVGNEFFAIHTWRKKQIAVKCLKIIGAIAIFCQVVKLCDDVRYRVGVEYDKALNATYDYEIMLEFIPQEEKESFIAYGDNYLKSIYLRLNQVPCYKYFAIQEWHALFSKKVKEDLYNVFSEGEVKWLLINVYPGTIKDVIRGKYVLVAINEDCYLYCLKSAVSEEAMKKGWRSCIDIEYDYAEADGLVWDMTGKWWYCENGVVDNTYTGVAENEYGQWIVVNGEVDFECSGLVQMGNDWLYAQSGAVISYTGLVQNELGWWYVEDGVVNFDYNGTALGPDGNHYKVVNGAVVFN